MIATLGIFCIGLVVGGIVGFVNGMLFMLGPSEDSAGSKSIHG